MSPGADEIRFRYKAFDQRGEVLEGELQATHADEVVEQIQRMGYLPVRAEPITASHVRPSWLRRSTSRCKAGQVDQLFAELEAMLNSGVELQSALVGIAGVNGEARIGALADDLRRSLREGMSFQEALARHRQEFSALDVSLVAAGEASGNLAAQLRVLVEYRRATRALQETLTTASIYPAIVLFVGLVSAVAIGVLILPDFAELFADAGVPMPLLTSAMLWAVESIAGAWWVYLAASVAVWLFVRMWFHQEENMRSFHAALIRLPLVGAMIRTLELSRFARALGTLVDGGVPLIRALHVAAPVVSNRVLRAEIDDLEGPLSLGEAPATAFRRSSLFNAASCSMLSAGEASGRLGPVLMTIGRQSDDTFRRMLTRGLTILEPLLVLGLAVFVGIIVLGLLLAVLALGDLPL